MQKTNFDDFINSFLAHHLFSGWTVQALGIGHTGTIYHHIQVAKFVWNWIHRLFHSIKGGNLEN